MMRKIARLFVIKTRFEACAVIYALGLGASERGFHYLQTYPGVGGWLLFAACTGAVRRPRSSPPVCTPGDRPGTGRPDPTVPDFGSGHRLTRGGGPGQSLPPGFPTRPPPIFSDRSAFQ